MIAIREAEPGDADDIREIVSLCGIDRRDYGDQGHYHRLVAVAEDGSVVGFIDGLFDVPVPPRPGRKHAPGVHPGPQAFGSLIVVHPDARRRGIGGALHRAFVLEAQQRGCTFFAAMVSWHDDHTDRTAFFRQCGMRDLVVGVPDDLVGAPIVDILAAIPSDREVM